MSLTLDDLTTEQQLFADALEEAGMPITEDDIKEVLQEIADDSNLDIANTSQYSAFWNFCQEAIISPTEFLTAFLIKNTMPGLYVKTAEGEMLDIIAWGYEITRNEAVKMQGELTFSRSSSEQAVTIPAGTIVRTIEINSNIYRVSTIDDAVLEEGVSSLRVLCEAEEAGSAYNLAASYFSILDSDVPGVTGVTNESDYLITAGEDEETDEDLRLRLQNHFSAVTDWHTDAKYKAMIAEQTGFSIDHIFFDHDIPRGAGSADAYILFDYGVSSTSTLEAINEYISTDGNHGHGDDLVVKAIPETEYDVSVEVQFSDSTTEEEATEFLSQIEQFIRCAFRENTDYSDYVTQTWPYARFSFSKLSGELHSYFSDIAALTWGQDDIETTLDIARLGTLTVTEAE